MHFAGNGQDDRNGALRRLEPLGLPNARVNGVVPRPLVDPSAGVRRDERAVRDFDQIVERPPVEAISLCEECLRARFVELREIQG